MIFLLVWTAWKPLVATDINLSATVDRQHITTEDIITYTIEIKGTQKFPNIPAPQSKDFVVISGPSQSSRVQIINGQMSASKSIQWRLAPTRSGELTIGPVEMVVDGERYSTKPLTIYVRKSGQATDQARRSAPSQPEEKETRQTGESDGPEIFLRAAANKSRVFKGEEIIVSFNLYFRPHIKTFSREKLPDAKGFWTESFPPVSQPQIEKVRYQGKQYNKATLQRLALFPTTSGKLTIDPMVINCEVVVPRKSRSPLNDFFNDPFADHPIFKHTQIERLHSQPLTIQVASLPSAGKPSVFGGLVGQYTINADVDTHETSLDKAITLTYNISGQGNINAVVIDGPELPNSVELFDPSVKRTVHNKGSHIRGTVTYEYVLIPRTPGLLEIPPLRLYYFDPAQEKYLYQEASGFDIRIHPKREYLSDRNYPLRKEEVALLGKDIRFIRKSGVNWQRMDAGPFTSVWFWMINSVALVIIIAVLGIHFRNEKLVNNVALARKKRAWRVAQERLEQAGQALNNEEWEAFLSHSNRALIGFVGDRLNLPDSGASMQAVMEALDNQGIDAGPVKQVEAILNKVAQARFSPDKTQRGNYHELHTENKRIISELSRRL